MSWPAVVLWIVLVFGILMPPPFLLYCFFAFGSFATLDLIPHELVGGFNMNSQSFCALLIIAKILLAKGNPRRGLEAALDPARLGVLFLFLAYGLFSAYVMPRLFEHRVEVFPTSAQLDWPVLLEPTMQNISQSAYMTLSVGMALAFTLVGGRPEFRRHYLQALLFGGLVLIATGLLDMTMASVGLTDLLEPFRNISGGTPLVKDSVLGSKRVVGLMSEASAYGGSCVAAASSLAFLRPCFPDWQRLWLVPAAIGGLIVMSYLSTSSSAYIGLGAFGLFFVVNWLRRYLTPWAPDREGLKWEAFIVIAAAILWLILIVLSPTVLDPIYEMVDTMIFKKTETSSYIGRTNWTKAGMDAFFATDGFGVGLGSARTSNWFVAILSNTGVIGATLLAWFIAQIFLRRCQGDPRTVEFVTALRFSLLPFFVTAALAGTIPDFGAGRGAIFGFVVSLTSNKRLPLPVSGPKRTKLSA